MKLSKILKRCAILLIGGLMLTGCATTPVPVRILDMTPKPVSEFTNGQKFSASPIPVSFVVRDSRSSITSKSNICGLKRNGYYIPMAVAFLAHGEGFDDVMMRRSSKLLSAAGYSILHKNPNVDQSEGVAEKERDSKVSKRQSGSAKNERKAAEADFKAAKKAGGSDAVNIDFSAATQAPSVFSERAPSGAIVELKVRSYFSDIVPFSSLLWPFIQSWMVADLYVYEEATGPRTVLFGKKLRSYNSVIWAPVDLGGETSYNASMNMAARSVLRQAEKLFYTDEFRQAVQKANAFGLSTAKAE